jgi:hypothetical protein
VIHFPHISLSGIIKSSSTAYLCDTSVSSAVEFHWTLLASNVQRTLLRKTKLKVGSWNIYFRLSTPSTTAGRSLSCWFARLSNERIPCRNEKQPDYIEPSASATNSSFFVRCVYNSFDNFKSVLLVYMLRHHEWTIQVVLYFRRCLRTCQASAEFPKHWCIDVTRPCPYFLQCSNWMKFGKQYLYLVWLNKGPGVA